MLNRGVLFGSLVGWLVGFCECLLWDAHNSLLFSFGWEFLSGVDFGVYWIPFLNLLKWSHSFLFLACKHGRDYIDRFFLTLNQPCISEINHTWSQCIILLTCLSKLTCEGLLHLCSQEILAFSFPVLSFWFFWSGFSYQINAGFIELGSIPSFSIFCKSLYRIDNIYSLYIWQNSPLNISAWSFLCRKLLNYLFYFFNKQNAYDFEQVMLVCVFQEMCPFHLCCQIFLT